MDTNQNIKPPYKGKIIVFPESHTEQLSAHGFWLKEGGAKTNEEKEFGERLFNYANELLNLKRSLLEKPEIDTVYLETRENDLTKKMYGSYLDGKKVVWLDEGLDDLLEILADRANRGMLDEFFYSMQKNREGCHAKTMSEKPPEKIGLLVYGNKHLNRGNITKLLEKEGYDVKVIKTKDYDALIEQDFRELGIPINYIRASAEV